MTTRALVSTQRRSRHRIRALRRVILDAHAARDARAHSSTRHHYTVVVVYLDPVVVSNVDLGGILIVDPERLDAARQRRHPMVVPVGRVNVPLAVWSQVVEHLGRPNLFAEAQVRILGWK